MELDAFNCRLGFSQGRLMPGGQRAGDEDFVFVLGEEERSYFHNLEPGDRVEIIQDTDLTDVDFVRADMTLRVPPSLPNGLVWEASIVVDGITMAGAICEPGRERRINDLVANVSKMTGVLPVGIRLQLVGT